MFKQLCALLLVAATTVPDLATASILSGNYEFTASGFPPEAPVAPVFGSFTLQGLDTTRKYIDDASLITRFSINIPL